MNRHTIEAAQKPILDVFCDKYLFHIPPCWVEAPIAQGVSREWGIMPRRPTARSGLHGAEPGDPSLSRAFHCRPRNEPEAGDRRLFRASASAVICSFAD
jgi:hypothetical protein